jgi:hypothetical protein
MPLRPQGPAPYLGRARQKRLAVARAMMLIPRLPHRSAPEAHDRAAKRPIHGTPRGVASVAPDLAQEHLYGI